MKKSTIIGIIVTVLIIVGIGIVFAVSVFNKPNEEEQGKIQISTTTDMENLIQNIYQGLEENLPALNTQVVDLNDLEAVTYNTGLTQTTGVDAIVISEPLMSAQAYSLVLVKASDENNAKEIAKTMFDSIDTRKWICVEADKVYATNTGNTAFLVMASEEQAKPVYEKFKELAGNVGEELER